MLQDSTVLATTHLSPSPGAEGDRTMCATAQDGSRLVKPAPSPSQPQSPLPATSGAGSACCSISPSVAAVHSPALYGSSTVSSSPSSNCCTSTASPPALPACALPDCAQTSPQQQQQQGRGPAHLDQGAPAAAAAMHLATPFAAAEAEAEAGPSGVQEADSDTEATPADIAATAAAEEPGTRPGAGVGGTQQPGPGQAAPCILKELGVSGPSLVRLLTGDCAVESQQPVWMVVNLQGKIKGSYTASKMLEFSVRGTLSSAQLVLGIDKDLPYTARQDLGFYRRLDAVLTAVHAGAAYTPLTHACVEALALSSTAATGWQPLVVPDSPPPAASITPCEGPGPAGTTSPGSAQHAAAVAADTRLQLALEKLCGYSGVTLAAAVATASRSESGQAPQSAAGSPSLSRASSASASCQGLPVLRRASQDGGSSSSNATTAPAAAAAAAAAAAVEGGGADSSGSKEPVWLYINHLGWCRGPFSGEKMVQAHLCGRLPRDTLVVCLNPELPPSLLCMDVAYYFRPFGVLLDNVANGWRYRPVDWQDVTGRGIIKAMQQQQSMQPPLQQQQQQQQQLPIADTPEPWSPLVWDETSDTPPPALLSPELLQPPKHVPAMQDQPGGQEGTWGGANSSTTCIKMPRRRRTKQPPTQPQQQLQQQQQFGPAGGRNVLMHTHRTPSPVLMNVPGGFGGHNIAGASEWTTMQQQHQQQQQGAVLLAAGDSSSSSGSQQLQAQVELQHHVMLLQLQNQQQQFVGVGATGLPGGALAANAQAPMLHIHAPAVLPLQQQQQLTKTWVLQQPTDLVIHHADSGSAQQQTQQLYLQQLLTAQGSTQLTRQLSAASYGSPSPDPYTDVQGVSTVLTSDANVGMNAAMHGMHGGMNGLGLVALSAGMSAVGLESLLQPVQVMHAVPAPPTSDALLLQLLTQQQQQQQQQYGLHSQMHASLGVNSPVPTCMGLAMQQQQQQMLLQLQRQPGASGLVGGGHIQGWAQ